MTTSPRRIDQPSRTTVQRLLAANDALGAAVLTFDWDALAEHAHELRRLGPAAWSPSSGDLSVASLGIMAASRSLQARVHVALNLAPRSRSRASVLRRRLDRAHHELRGGLLAAAASLHGSWSQPGGIEAARRLVDFVDRRLPAFAAVQGSIVRALPRDEASRRETESLRTLLVDAGATTRDAIAMHAGALRGLVDGPTELVPPELDVEVHSAPRATIGSLPDVGDGELVTTEGDVQAIRVVRRDRLTTHVQLVDRNGATARLDVPFAHLPHAGLTRGARIRATGTVVGRDAAGRPILEADRLDPARLAERAWIKRLVRQAAPWFHRWCRDAAVDWSLGRHEDLDDRAGAAELVHAPNLGERRI